MAMHGNLETYVYNLYLEREELLDKVYALEQQNLALLARCEAGYPQRTRYQGHVNNPQPQVSLFTLFFLAFLKTSQPPAVRRKRPRATTQEMLERQNTRFGQWKQ